MVFEAKTTGDLRLDEHQVGVFRLRRGKRPLSPPFSVAQRAVPGPEGWKPAILRRKARPSGESRFKYGRQLPAIRYGAGNFSIYRNGNQSKAIAEKINVAGPLSKATSAFYARDFEQGHVRI